MLNITPVREHISERFPVASFVVSVPPDRYFEVACATDPALFHADQKHRRTAANFATSRLGGLLRAPAGQATYLIPPQQLRKFAGAQRLYYALATFRGARNEDPILTVAHDRLDRTPSIRISPDFTGRSLDRGKLGAADARYGGEPGVLGWGGDDVLVARGGSARLGTGGATAEPFVYDDGFDASLWEAKASDDEEDDEDEGGEVYGRRGRDPSGEPRGYEDAAELMLCSVEPSGYEDATALPHELAAWQPAELEDELSYGGRPAAAPPPAYLPPPPQASPPAARYGGAAATHHERYGSVTGAVRPPDDAPAYGYGGELDGYEDVPDLVRNLGPRSRPFLGNGAAALPAPTAPPPVTLAPPAAPTPPAPEPAQATRFPDYSDELAVAEVLPEVAAGGADEVLVPADPRHRLRIVDRVALAESGAERYLKVATDPRAGLLWGYCQLGQRSGALGHALRVCHRRDRAAFVRVFGEHNAAPPGDDLELAALPAGHLLRVTNADDEDARMAPVTPPAGGAPAPLAQAPWLDVFRAAGDVQAFQEAQREVADRRFYLPYLDFLRWLGIRSVRGHAMFVDRALQMGGGGAARWIARTAGPVRSEEDLRRALAHLGHAELRSFQAAPQGGVTLPAADGVFGALSHAALAGALAARGDSPLPLRSEEQMLAALVAEADRQAAGSPLWREAARRLHALAEDPALLALPRLPSEPPRSPA